MIGVSICQSPPLHWEPKLFRLDSDGSIHDLSIAKRSQPGFPIEDIDDPAIHGP